MVLSRTSLIFFRGRCSTLAICNIVQKEQQQCLFRTNWPRVTPLKKQLWVSGCIITSKKKHIIILLLDPIFLISMDCIAEHQVDIRPSKRTKIPTCVIWGTLAIFFRISIKSSIPANRSTTCAGHGIQKRLGFRPLTFPAIGLSDTISVVVPLLGKALIPISVEHHGRTLESFTKRFRPITFRLNLWVYWQKGRS